MQTVCWKVLVYDLKASYWAASQDLHIYFHWKSSKQVMTVYIILTNYLLIIAIFVTMLLNVNKYLQNTKKACYKKKKKRNLHIQCVTYMKLRNNS